MDTNSSITEKRIGDVADLAGQIGPHTELKPGNIDKAFATLTALYALKGYELIRGNPADGAAAYYAMRWDMVKVLPTLDAARAFLAQIGGAA
ncbi:hypothetical protein [Variovorax sp. J22R115]|uniref:hypothetical protein n=1 Tax=Variovorax sp. J22R115 TaxID=3053509 RepID=UPI0025790EC9|nr:hypothetical protein [Variovorax sp. J22R115]MDM0051414.1 hypothetical protein [Variovorax sp. J22R115]